MEATVWQLLVSLICGTLAGLIISYIRIRMYEKEREVTERQLFVHRLQFETEFELYKKLWFIIVDVKTYAIEFVPIRSTTNTNLSEEDGNEIKKMSNFKTAMAEYRNFTFANYPFLLPQIYEKTVVIYVLVSERVRVGSDYVLSKTDWPENEENLEKINEEINKIGSMIRERIMIPSKGTLGSYLPKDILGLPTKNK